jgi:penicillin-binding protein 1A
VAGKTGTTSSNKDGWFIGFSSGLTTGVWMGRDDARRVAGLQGGTAPARAFSDFMRVAVARRPVQAFQLEVPLPDWQLEPDEEVWGNTVAETPLVDADGNPIDPSAQPDDELGPRAPAAQPGEDVGPDQQWLDEVLDRNPPAPQPGYRPAPAARQQSPYRQPTPYRQPPPGYRPAPSAPADPLEPRPEAAEF